MSRDYLERKEIGDYRISIYPDYDAECPVTNWDMGAIHLFEHLERGRYWLSSVCDWKEWVSNTREESITSILQRMVAKWVSQDDLIKYIKAGNIEGLRLVYNRHERMWQEQIQYARAGRRQDEWDTVFEVEPSDLKVYDYRDELLECLEDDDDLIAIIEACAKDVVIKSWSSCGYCQGDHMRGLSYMTKEHFDKRCGFSPSHYKTWQEQALAVIEGEVKCIELWAWGDVKGFVLEKKVSFTKVFDDNDREDEEDYEWEEVDSCWGYFMETEELIKEVMSEHDIKEVA